MAHATDLPSDRPVALGSQNNNVFNYSPERLYGFLYHIEDHDPDADNPPWLLRLEGLGAAWFDEKWRFFREQFEGSALEAELAPVGEQLIQDAYTKLPLATQQRLFDIHLRYHLRTYLADDPAPVSLVEILVDPAHIGREDLVEGYWYVFNLHPGKRTLSDEEVRQPQTPGEVILGEVGLSREQDSPVEVRTIRAIDRISRVDANLHRLLSALYFPQVNPGAGQPAAGATRKTAKQLSADFIKQIGEDDEDGGVLKRSREAYEDDEDEMHDEHDEEEEEGDGGRNVRPRRDDLPIAVVAPAAAIAPPPPPPAVFRKYVGVNNIGSGNNIAVWDPGGQKIAYFDFGYPTPQNGNTATGLPHPCACGDPLMILSHWDYDHYAMVRNRPEARRPCCPYLRVRACCR